MGQGALDLAWGAPVSYWPFDDPTHSTSAFASASRVVLPATTAAPHEARQHVRGACAGLPGDVVDTAVLITSELVTNAVLHPRASNGFVVPVVGLECARDEGRVRVAVSDLDPRLPALRQPQGLEEGGWGLQVLTRLAHGCGVTPLADGRGKTVWFELRLRSR